MSLFMKYSDFSILVVNFNFSDNNFHIIVLCQIKGAPYRFRNNFAKGSMILASLIGSPTVCGFSWF